MSASNELENLRILIVEDEYLVASDIVEAIQKAGGEVLGPCPDNASARAALAQAGRPPDAAILDLNVKGDFVGELAHELARTDIRLVYYTGYDTSPEDEGLPPGVLIVKSLARAELTKQFIALLKDIRRVA